MISNYRAVRAAVLVALGVVLLFIFFVALAYAIESLNTAFEYVNLSKNVSLSFTDRLLCIGSAIYYSIVTFLCVFVIAVDLVLLVITYDRLFKD